jgi:hypothetical protein
MGAHFSTSPKDFQILARNTDGRLHIFNMDKIDKLQECSRLPFEMEENVRYAFLSTADKKWHAHVFADNICDIPGNDVVSSSTIKNKNANTINYSAHSNSNFFLMNSNAPNKPDHSIFYDKDGFPQYSSISSFQKCVPMPMWSMPDNSDIAYNHNYVPLSFYTDEECKNEYISVIPPTEETKNRIDRKFNEDNRAFLPNHVGVPYTDIKTTQYSDPAPKTNARYYRSYREGYPLLN